MPELPDVTVYVETLERWFVGKVLHSVQIRSPFFLRSFEVDPQDVEGRRIDEISRIGKRIVFTLEGDYQMVFHLMIAGRFHWRNKVTQPIRKVDLAALQFDEGTLLITEASSKKRASLHIVRGTESLEPFLRGGLELATATKEEFANALTRENRTLKRALTDPRILSGIGNAYSDEILHAAGLSPLRRTSQLSNDELHSLLETCQQVLMQWTRRLREKAGDGFPEKVTAFHPEMAVHGKYGQPCPVCNTDIQRVRYAENEMNYCPRCQTGGKLLADRSLSRLLGADWPKTIEELEA